MDTYRCYTCPLMDTYRRTHNQFFLDCAYLRKSYGLNTLSLTHVLSGKWLTEREIKDFTVSYMMGGEL
jgi:hypothetical protein